MSEVGTQLVANERKRKDCRRDARRILLQVLAKLSADSDEGLAELDVEGAKVLVQQLGVHKQAMRELLSQRRDLAAAAAEE